MQRNGISNGREAAGKSALPVQSRRAVRMPKVSIYIGGCFVNRQLALDSACCLLTRGICSRLVQVGRLWRLERA